MQHIKNLIQLCYRSGDRGSREPWAYLGSFGDDFLCEDDDEAADG